MYEERCAAVSDINEHLPTLRKLAEGADSVLELGIRDGNSTVALLAARPERMVSVDVNAPPPTITNLWQRGWIIVLGDSRRFDSSAGFDMCFIDTLHCYEQLKAELALHAPNVKRYIALHDTTTFGETEETGGPGGLMPAVREFLEANPEWHILRQYENNNGLLVLAR